MDPNPIFFSCTPLLATLPLPPQRSILLIGSDYPTPEPPRKIFPVSKQTFPFFTKVANVSFLQKFMNKKAEEEEEQDTAGDSARESSR